MPTHYETLGVPRTATADEIRRAYHVQARRWHPDRAGGAAPAELGRAEDAMRRVNEAWRVLSDPGRRRDYDRDLDQRAGATRTAAGPSASADGGVPRIDPRLLDPDYLASRRYEHFEEIDRRHAVVLRMIPLLAFVVLLAAIVVVTAYARPRFEGPAAPTTVPGPAIGVPAGSCVRILTGPSLLEVPCDGTRDGVVVGVRADPNGGCPARTIRQVPLPSGAVVCLAP